MINRYTGVESGHSIWKTHGKFLLGRCDLLQQKCFKKSTWKLYFFFKVPSRKCFGVVKNKWCESWIAPTGHMKCPGHKLARSPQSVIEHLLIYCRRRDVRVKFQNSWWKTYEILNFNWLIILPSALWIREMTSASPYWHSKLDLAQNFISM